MSNPLRILLAEDSEDDALLLMRHLRKGGYDPIYRQVESASAMRAALEENDWDIVISDYQMPQFSGLDALSIFSKSGLEIPFIVVSGTIGEELAVEAMRAGAHDYLMKDNLARLLPAIQRELREAHIRRDRKKSEQTLIESEQQYRILFESSPEAIVIIGLNGEIIDCNPAVESLTGLKRYELISQPVTTLDLDLLKKAANDDYLPYFTNLLSDQKTARFEAKLRHLHGDTRWLEIHLANLNREGKQWAIQAIMRDITERKSTEEVLQNFAERLTILHEVDKAILSARSAEKITQAALHHVRMLIPYLVAGVTIIDSETNEPDLLAAYHNENLIDETGFPFNMIYEIPEVMSVLENSAPFIIEDTAAHPRMRAHLHELGLENINTLLNIPLIFQGELIGFMIFGAENATVFGGEQIDIAYELALQLAIAIQQARLHEAIAYHAIELEVRVEERTAELQAANERLVALSRAKDEFVSNVSHELRTPLTSLLMRQNLLARTPENLTKHLKVMDRETMRLKYMLEDLLRLSRLDQGRTQLEPIRFDLNNLIVQYLEDRMLLAQENKLNLSYECSESILTTQADYGLMEQVLGILVNNAINYTPEGGSIVVRTFKRVESEEAFVCFSIRDTGPGITEDELSQLFERFYRGKAGRKSQVPGTGLGLAIAKEVIDRHNGHIHVESEGIEGKGTTFTVCLPAYAR
ncbi:PAS domain S-box protein [Phototrophicus methaneseepsis]|uniref:histidine kinase n=1 Tax=Phototrophicus methaneseepsis TaxID=2710758 RepID=A0A7S8IFT9_9CHLR|nr:ATP-binding protein [Phototrophicus methaneseepsis]QPC83952.1 PAS domain S-box protein [Phototrophicus methaneseepsis]